MNNKINLIFDFDGTLFDSYDSIVDWLYRSFKYYGIDVSKEVLRERAIFKDVGYAIDKTCAEYKIEKEK